MHSFHNAAAAAAGAQTPGINIALGELIRYDPETHSGTFQLPNYIDNLDGAGSTDSGEPIDTGLIPIGTLFAGPGYGMRFMSDVGTPQAPGAQAMIVFSDNTLEHPLCALFFFNIVDYNPFNDIITQGWLDKTGNQVSTDANGQSLLIGTQSAAVSAPVVGLGDLFSNLGDDDAVVTVAMLRSAVTTVFNSHTHSGVTTGSGISGVPNINMVPQGSTTVRAKE